MEKFPLPYLFDVDKKTTYSTKEVVFESGKKQIQRTAVQPKKEWTFSCRGDNTQREVLENFFDSVGGNTTPFLFEDENGKQQTVRFSQNGLTIRVKRDYSLSSGTKGIPVGFEASITVERVL